MHVETTKKVLKEAVKSSAELSRLFASTVLLAPQVLHEDDLHELRDLADEAAKNYEVVASYLYCFGRITPSSKKFFPSHTKSE